MPWVPHEFYVNFRWKFLFYFAADNSKIDFTMVPWINWYNITVIYWVYILLYFMKNSHSWLSEEKWFMLYFFWYSVLLYNQFVHCLPLLFLKSLVACSPAHLRQVFLFLHLYVLYDLIYHICNTFVTWFYIYQIICYTVRAPISACSYLCAALVKQFTQKSIWK